MPLTARARGRPLSFMRFLACTLPVASCAFAALCAACADASEIATAPRTPASGNADVGAEAARGNELDLESIGCSTTAPVRRAPPEFDDADPSAVRLFFDVLAPYGAWVEDSRLGLVWMPAREGVGAAFVPYATQGRWTHRAFESAGNVPVDEYVWVSDLPWGWVTFHYGRWTFAGDRGWAWVPGRRYAGAWVDWRAPERTEDASAQHGRDLVVGWGPTPPSILWRIAPGPVASRMRDARLVAQPYAAFATPYAYVRARELFTADIGERLLYGPAALAVAHGTQSSNAPRPELLGFRSGEVPAPPTLDRGLQQAWMLATPATASAVGAGPELGAPPRLRTYVTGGPHYAWR